LEERGCNRAALVASGPEDDDELLRGHF
jgi:hypothetical protein